MRKHHLLRLLAVLLGFSLVVAACGSDDEDESTGGDDSGETTDDGGDAGDSGSDSEDVVEATQDGDLLAAIQARGELNCGVSTVSIGRGAGLRRHLPGLRRRLRRATAAAILGDANALQHRRPHRRRALHGCSDWSGRPAPPQHRRTQSRDSGVGMDFGPTTYFDGQQLMARVGDGFSSGSSVADIDGAVVCTNAGTTTEKNIAEAADLLGITITLNTFEDFDIVTQNFIEGACDVITTDGSGLVGRKAEQQPADQEWVIFPVSRSRRSRSARPTARTSPVR